MRTHENNLNSLSEDARQSWKTFFVASSLIVAEVDRTLQLKGIGSLSEFDTLYTLEKGSPDGLSIRELTASLTLSHSGLSRLLDRLELRGAIERCKLGSDKRSVQVKLLPEGQAILDSMWKIYSSIVQEYFGQVLSRSEHIELNRLCSKLCKPIIEHKEVANKLPYIHR